MPWRREDLLCRSRGQRRNHGDLKEGAQGRGGQVGSDGEQVLELVESGVQDC